MLMTYKEMEQTILDGLNSSQNYGEVENGNVSILVQIYQPKQWRVQFYHKETRLLVQAEHIWDNDDYTLRLIYESLDLFKGASVEQIQNMQKFTQNLIAVRELENGIFDAEFYPLTCVREFVQISELFHYDESIKELLDGNGHYPTIKKRLEKYGIEK